MVPLRGILLQARDTETGSIVGRWSTSDSDHYFRTIRCGGLSDSAVTSTTIGDKPIYNTFTWTPPLSVDVQEVNIS